MFRRPKFEDNIYMKMFRWVYILLIGNLCTLLAALPFTAAGLLLAIDVRNLPAFFICGLFAGPALMALLALLNEFKEQGDVEPVVFYFRAYRQFAARGLLYWLIGWFGILVSLTDILFFASLPNGQWVVPFFLLLGILTTALSLNCWYFQVRNPNSGVKDVLRIAAFYTFKKWYFSLLNTVLFVAMIGLMLLKPQFGWLLTPALFLGLIYLNCGLLHKQTQVS